MSKYLHVENILYSANRLGLLHEKQQTQIAYHPVVNQAILVLTWLSSNCIYKTVRGLDNNGDLVMNIIELSGKIECSVHTTKCILTVLIKLQIIEQVTIDNNKYYKLIPF